MSQTEASKGEKYKVLQRIEQVTRRTFQAEPRRSDWRISRDRKVSVFMTFSIFNSTTNKAWYDISKSDIGAWRAYSRSFIVFIVGDSTHCLVVPLPVLEPRLKGLTLARDGSYKLHIKESFGRYEILELPRFDVAPYDNRFDLIAP